MFQPEKMILINIDSGNYTKYQEGNERRNFTRELDGRYYGYCPPHDNIDIHRNFPCRRGDEYVDGILVVYVKEAKGAFNKRIVGFAPSARLYAKPQPRIGEGVFYTCSENENLTYSIRSDVLYKIDDMGIENIIFNTKREKNIFRAQRIYGRNFPDIAMDVISKLENIFYDDDDPRYDVLASKPATKVEAHNSYRAALKFCDGGKKISKNIAIAKSALEAADYKCQINPMHETFITPKRLPYMEGHHLIPCSFRNAKDFMETKQINLDCFQNIICLCPNCHRAIHHGDEETKKSLIGALYSKKRKQFMEIGLDIDESQLFKLYEITKK